MLSQQKSLERSICGTTIFITGFWVVDHSLLDRLIDINLWLDWWETSVVFYGDTESETDLNLKCPLEVFLNGAQPIYTVDIINQLLSSLTE